MSDPGNSDQRLREIEARLAAIEQRLGIASPPPAAPAAPAATAAPAAPPRYAAPVQELPIARAVIPVAAEPATGARPTPRPPPLPTMPTMSTLPVAAVAVEAPLPPPPPPPEPSSSSPPAVEYAPVARPAPPVRHSSLEQTIGLKWAGWIGAVILVIGLGLGIKFGYDQGWFGGVSDTVKLALCWVGSFALIAAGEVVYRRVNRLSATGLFGAGVASLFLVSYAGHGYFDLYTRGTAFTLMAASTVAGALVAMRGRMSSIAVLALIGGNLAPALIGSEQPQAGPFFAYLLGLQLVAVFLAWWGGSPRWWALRGLSLATTSFWTLVALAVAVERQDIDPRGWPSAYVVLFAVLYQAELILSARTGGRAGRKPGAVFSLLVTAALATALVLCHHDSTDAVRGWVVVIIAAACAAVGYASRAMQRSAERGDNAAAAAALRALAVSFAVQAAVLLVVAVPVAFSGWAVMTGWAALAVGFALAGAWLDLNVPRRAAAVTWGLAIVYLVFWLDKHWDREQARVAFTILHAGVPQYLLVAMGLSAVGHAIAAVIGPRRAAGPPSTELAVWAGLVQVAAGVVWAGAAILALPPAGATLVILAYAWLCAVADAARPGLRLAWHAAGAVAVAMVKWAVVDVVQARLSPDWSPSAEKVLFNATAGTGLAIAVSMLAIWRLRRRELMPSKAGDARGGWALAMPLGVLVVATFGLSFEVDRGVQQLAAGQGGRLADLHWAQVEMLCLTMLWSLCAAAGAAIVRVVRGFAGARAAAVLATVAATVLVVKYVLLDTLIFRLTAPPADVRVGVNLQVLAAAALLGLIALAWWFDRSAAVGQRPGRLPAFVGLLATLLPLWVLTLEIDRWAGRQATPWMARQAGWSICWSAYAVLLVVLGFRARAAAMRYIGLTLFAVTLLKVVLIDLSAASTGWRILSFFGLGGLLLATSVIYGKISPILLAEDEQSPPPAPSSPTSSYPPPSTPPPPAADG